MNEPDKLRFWIGGFGSTGYELTYNGVTLEYRQSACYDSGGDVVRETVSVDQDAWDSFRQELDMIGVWDWHSSYESNARDGTQWEFRLDWQYRHLNIHGSNCYPESDGSPSDACERTRSFRRFLQALGQLAGGKRIE